MLKKIEERKKQKLANNQSILENGVKSSLEELKKKRKKHKNLSNTLDAESTNVSHFEDRNRIDENINELSPKVAKALAKKKKRKKKDSESKDDSTAECLITKREKLEKRSEDIGNDKEENDNENTAKEELPLPNSFTVLGAKSHKKQRAVKRVLPDWLAHPRVICADLNSGPSLEELDSILDPKLIEILKANGIVKLFPVQYSVINWLHKCNIDRKMGWWLRDTCVSAPTGSGKYL